MTTRKKGIDYGEIFIVLVVTGMGFLTLYPFIYTLSVSVSPPLRLTESRVLLWPLGLSSVNYRYTLNDQRIVRGFANSILYTSTGTAISVMLTMMTAYPLSQDHFRKYGNFFMKMIVVTMMFTGGLIPTYLLVRGLGMIDTLWAVVIPTCISPFYLILARTFVRELPKDLSDAAIVDGANESVIFFRIVLPLSKPIIACITLYYAVGVWNNFFVPLLYLNDDKRYPLQVFLRNIVIGAQMMEQQYASRGMAIDSQMSTINTEGIKAATLVISTIPILAIYPFVQKYFVKGIMLGAIKG